MEFGQNVVTEITVPNNVPFLPGNDIIGIGTQLPPELEAYGITAAMVFYNQAWSPVATTPRVKFMFIGTTHDVDFGAMVFGYGYCNNPSLNQVAVVTTTYQIGMDGTTVPGRAMSYTLVFNSLDNKIVETSEDTLRNSQIIGYDNDGAQNFIIPGDL